jgi:hypothetical protein
LLELLVKMHIEQRPNLLSQVYDALGVPHEGAELGDGAFDIELKADDVAPQVCALKEAWPLEDLWLCMAVMADSCSESWAEAVTTTKAKLHALLEEDRGEKATPKTGIFPSTYEETPEASDRAGQETVAPQAPDFTTLDRAVIRSIVSTLNHVEGSLSEEDLDDLVQEFVELNDARSQTRFHRGFLDAVLERDLAPADSGENRDRRAWYVVGHLMGQVRCHPDLDLLKAVRSLPNEDRQALLDSACPAGAMLAEQMMRAMLEAGESREAIRWIRAHGMRTAEGLARRLAGWSSQALLDQADPSAVRQILQAFLEQVDALGEDEDHSFLGTLVRVVQRRLAIALRISGRLTQAKALVERLLESCKDEHERARLFNQKVLIALGVRSLEQLELPSEDGPRALFLATLEDQQPGLVAAVQGDVPSSIALFALALPVVANPHAPEVKRAEAAHGLRRVIDLMDRSGEAVWEHTGVLSRARFYLAVLDLRSGHPGDVASAADRLQALLEEGAPLPGEMVLDAVEDAVLHEAPRVTELACLAIGRFRHRALEKLDIAGLACRSVAFRRALVDTLGKGSDDLKATERWNAWMELLRGCVAADQRDLETAGLALDALEVLARTPELAQGFLDLLEETDLWDPIWDQSERDEARFRVYRELGRLDDAQPILVSLVHHAISDARFEDAEDLLGLLDALQPDPVDLSGGNHGFRGNSNGPL